MMETADLLGILRGAMFGANPLGFVFLIFGIALFSH